MAVLPTDYTDSTTPTGATTEYPATTTRGLNATHTQVNTNTAVLGGTGQATLTDPKIGTVKDTNGNTWITSNPIPSAVNYFMFENATAGAAPQLKSAGADGDIGILILPKGTGGITIYTPAGVTPRIQADSGDANTNLNLLSKSAGTVQVNGNDVFHTGSAIPAANIPSGITNGNTALQSQTVVSATAYYITGSNLNLPATLKAGMVVGTRFRWRVAMAKTAAGTGIFEIIIYRGTAGTTADTADVAQTIGTQTAVIDNMIVDVELAVTTTGATGAYYWTICPVNTISSTTTAAGFGVPKHTAAFFTGTKSSVAMNTASLKFGLGFRATTGTPTITVPMVQASAINIS